jgi:hypothetical protein
MAKDQSGQRRKKNRSSRVPLTYYRSARSSDTSDSPFEKKTPRAPGKARKWLLGIIDLILLGFLIIGLLYSMLVKAEPKVAVSDTSYHSSDTYRLEAERLFKSVGNRNKVTLNEQAVIKAMQQKFPEIAGGTIELPLFSQKPTLRLSVSPPAFKLKTTASSSYIIDADGKAVAKTRELPGIKNLPEIVDQSNFRTEAGKQVLNSDSVAFISTVLAECHHGNVTLKTLSLPSRAQELDVAAIDQPYYAKFFVGGNAVVQTGQFLAARHQFEASGSQPSQYLDVRVPGKIFYK